MGQKALEAGDLDREIGRLLEEAAKERDMSHRQLAAVSGVSRARIDRVLAGVRPIYASEIQALADALGLVAWKVVQQAEEGDTLASSRLLSPSPATGPSATGVAPVVRLPERHPRHHHPDEPLDHVPDPEDTYEPEPEPDTEPADAYHTAEGYGLAASDHEGTVETDELAMMDDGA